MFSICILQANYSQYVCLLFLTQVTLQDHGAVLQKWNTV